MTTPQTPSLVNEDEAIYELEKVLGARKDLEPDELAVMQEALENLSLRQVIELIERQPSKRGAGLLRLLAPQRATAAFDALDPGHQADIVGALAHEDVTDLFAALGVEDRVQLLDNLPAEIADQVMSGLDEEERESTNALMGYERGTVGRHMSPDVLVVEPADGVEGVVDKLKAEAENLETIYTLPVVCLLYTSDAADE